MSFRDPFWASMAFLVSIAKIVGMKLIYTFLEPDFYFNNGILMEHVFCFLYFIIRSYVRKTDFVCLFVCMDLLFVISWIYKFKIQSELRFAQFVCIFISISYSFFGCFFFFYQVFALSACLVCSRTHFNRKLQKSIKKKRKIEMVFFYLSVSECGGKLMVIENSSQYSVFFFYIAGIVNDFPHSMIKIKNRKETKLNWSRKCSFVLVLWK